MPSPRYDLAGPRRDRPAPVQVVDVQPQIDSSIDAALADYPTMTEVDAALESAIPLQVVASQWGTISGSVDLFLLVAAQSATVQKVVIVSSGGTTSDVSNFIAFQLRNLTTSLDLLSAPASTNGAEIVADTRKAIVPNQHAAIAPDDVLELQITYTGAPGSLPRLSTFLVLE